VEFLLTGGLGFLKNTQAFKSEMCRKKAGIDEGRRKAGKRGELFSGGPPPKGYPFFLQFPKSHFVFLGGGPTPKLGGNQNWASSFGGGGKNNNGVSQRFSWGTRGLNQTFHYPCFLGKGGKPTVGGGNLLGKPGVSGAKNFVFVSFRTVVHFSGGFGQEFWGRKKNKSFPFFFGGLENATGRQQKKKKKRFNHRERGTKKTGNSGGALPGWFEFL